MNYKGILIDITGIILSFFIFALSMVYADQIPLLTITGILGLSSTSYFVYRIVSRWIHHQKI